MKHILAALVLIILVAATTQAFPVIPGRIAISSDGNNHDCDDIAATPITIALLAQTGNAAKLVHYSYADHVWGSDTVETCGSVTNREAEMEISAHDTAELWGGFDLSVFINARANTATAISHLTAAINDSSAGNPLWIIAAGPMEIVGEALESANSNRQFVTVISHSEWNDNHSDNPEGGEGAHSGWTWAEMQSAFTNVTFKHIADQNDGLTVSENNYFWLRDSYDAKLTWLWDRHVVSGEASQGHFDPSDAGMVYWLITGGGSNDGDEGATPRKLRFVLEPYVYPASGAAWDTATPAEMGFDPTAFATALATLPDKSIVIRNGYVVGTKGNVTTTGLIWSASKSMVGLIFARQLQLGNVGYDNTVPGSNNPSAPLATYRHFLSMTSDYGISDPSHSPGNHYAYNNAAVHHYGTHLKTTFYAGQTHVQTLQNAFVTTLGFEDALGYNTAGFMSGWDGGWSMSARDLARVAYLTLRGGLWKGTQVVDADFATTALYANQVPGGATAGNNGDPFFDEGDTSDILPGAYSFAFWLPSQVTHPSSGFQPGCPSATAGTAMSGAFGTSAQIIPSLDLIIVGVNTSGEHAGGKITCQMLDAVAASVDDEDEPTVEGTYYVRNGGGTTSQCTGLANADYPGSGTGQACAYSNLQNAIDAAELGDTIALAAGQSFPSPLFNGFIFGDKGAGSEFITVTTTNPGGLPTKLAAYPTNFSFTTPSQYRVTTAEAAQMPKIVASDGFAAPINFSHAAHHWKFVGIEVTNNTTFNNSLVSTSTAPESDLSEFAHDIWFESCYLHPKEETGNFAVNYQFRSVEKGIFFNGTNLTVKNCSIQGFTGRDLSGTVLLDTNAILYATGVGGVDIQNSLLEGQSNNLWLGGGGPQLVPSNHTATVTSPTVTSGTFSQTTDLAVGDLFGVFIQSIASTLVTNTDDPNGLFPTPILSGWGVGKVLTKSGNNLTFEPLTSSYDYRRFELKFGTGVTGGTFTLTFHGQTTGAISFSSNRTTLANNVRTALETLSNIAPADIAHVNGDVVYVAAPTYGVEVLFADSFIQSLPANFTVNGSGLTGSGVVTVRNEPHWAEYYTSVIPSQPPNSGAAARWEGTVPDGFTIKRNIIAKYELWYLFNGPQKGYGEAKSGKNYLFEGNIFSGLPTGMIWEVKNQGGDSPWSTIDGVIMRSNLWTPNGSSIAMAFTDGTNRTTPGSNFLITNNLFISPGPNPSGEETWAGNSSTGGSNVTVTHNTMLLSGRVVFAVCGEDGPEAPGFSQLKNWIVKDNIMLQRGGFFVPIRLSTDPPYNFNDIRACWPNMIANHNVVIDDLNLGNPSGFFTINPDNPHPTSIAAVGFTSAPASLNYTGDYRLASTSQYKNSASDGTDPGINYSQLVADMGFDPFGQITQQGMRGKAIIKGKGSLGRP